MCLLLIASGTMAQDSLLLITGKKLDLRGAVVHYDDQFVYFQSDRQTSRMEKDAAAVTWGEGNWKHYGKRIARKRAAAVLKSGGENIILNDVDRLLLTNGKYKWLSGKVVHYDFDFIQYQTLVQADHETRLLKRKGLTKEEFDAKQQAKNSGSAAGQEQRIKEFEERAAEKMSTLSEQEFNAWKQRELLKLKEAEMASSLKSSKRKKPALFSKRISRDLVFSILHSDNSEEVVYNADTLGYFADGEAEVDYGVTEMRSYIAGRQAGRKHNTAFDMILGVGVGTISAAVGSFWGPSIPAGTVIVTSIANVKIKNKAGIDQALLDDPAFRDGYDRSAKRKKAWNFIKGSVAGLSFGLLVGDGLFRNQLIPAPR
ncbi:MAG: hypothetical protein RL266_2193 [Bacteroidota bacterium]